MVSSYFTGDYTPSTTECTPTTSGTLGWTSSSECTSPLGSALRARKMARAYGLSKECSHPADSALALTPECTSPIGSALRAKKVARAYALSYECNYHPDNALSATPECTSPIGSALRARKAARAYGHSLSYECSSPLGSALVARKKQHAYSQRPPACRAHGLSQDALDELSSPSEATAEVPSSPLAQELRRRKRAAAAVRTFGRQESIQSQESVSSRNVSSPRDGTPVIGSGETTPATVAPIISTATTGAPTPATATATAAKKTAFDFTEDVVAAHSGNKQFPSLDLTQECDLQVEECASPKKRRATPKKDGAASSTSIVSPSVTSPTSIVSPSVTSPAVEAVAAAAKPDEVQRLFQDECPSPRKKRSSVCTRVQKTPELICDGKSPGRESVKSELESPVFAPQSPKARLRIKTYTSPDKASDNSDAIVDIPSPLRRRGSRLSPASPSPTSPALIVAAESPHLRCAGTDTNTSTTSV